MKYVILHNDSCDFTLKNGKTIRLKGWYAINQLSNDDFTALLQEYPVLKTWEEKGFATFNDEKLDNKKADNALNDEKQASERLKAAEIEADKIIKDAMEKASKITEEAVLQAQTLSDKKIEETELSIDNTDKGSKKNK